MRTWLKLGAAQFVVLWLISAVRYGSLTSPVPGWFMSIGSSRSLAAASWLVCAAVILIACRLAGQRRPMRFVVASLTSLVVFNLLQIPLYFITLPTQLPVAAIAFALWLLLSVESIGTAVVVCRLLDREWATGATTEPASASGGGSA